MISACIAGLGNIGSALVPLLARTGLVRSMILVDPDSYESANLQGQSIDAAAVGQPKVAYARDLVESIDPTIEVTVYPEQIENVPPGCLEGSLLLSCPDRRGPRQRLSELACRLGSHLLDAAVDAQGLVRVNAYAPGRDRPCIECGWDEQAYDLLEQEYPCRAGATGTAPTAAPAELGALAAALLAHEVRKFAAGDLESMLIGKQLMLDLRSHAQHMSGFSYNRACRFDHEPWAMETVPLDPARATLEDAFELETGRAADRLRLELHTFVTYLDCVVCGVRTPVGLVAIDPTVAPGRACHCGGRLFAPGFFQFDEIERHALSRPMLERSLASIGVRAGDVLSLVDDLGRRRYYAIDTEEQQ